MQPDARSANPLAEPKDGGGSGTIDFDAATAMPAISAQDFAAAAPQPRVARRHLLTILGFCACFVMEVNRNMAVVIIPMAAQFGWDHATVGIIFASGMYGYTPMQIPSGIIAHHFDRPTLQIFICMMSLAVLNFAIPVVAGGDPSTLYFVLVPMGVAQALLNPSLHKLIASWAPVNERTRVHNTIYAGQNGGRMVSTATSALIASAFGWPWVFRLNAAICAGFGLAWITTVHDSPAKDPRISAAEREQIQASFESGADASQEQSQEPPSFRDVPWADVLRSAPFWAVVINHFAFDWASGTAGGWIPQWLKQDLGFDLKNSGFLATVPQLVTFIVVVISGPAALKALDEQRLSVTALRKLAQGVGLLVPAALLLLLCIAGGSSRGFAIVLMVLSVAFGGLTYSGHHVNHIDLSPTYAPILYATTNTLANLASVIGPVVNGALLGSEDIPSRAKWNSIFLLSALIQVFGGAVWLLAASGKRQPWGEEGAPTQRQTRQAAAGGVILVLLFACGLLFPVFFSPDNTSGSEGALPAPINLRLEGLLPEEAVITESLPRFSFVHGDVALPRGAQQHSYRINVKIGDEQLWDSGDVASRNMSQIEYAGPALPPFTRFTWTARWTAANALGSSAPAEATFETGPISDADWQGAKWLVGDGGQYRLAFELPSGNVEWARAYVAATGCHSIRVNGRVPAPDLRGICPWPVDALKKIRFQTHDLTALLHAGANCVGLLAGHAVPRGSKTPAVLALLMVQMADGSAPLFLSSAHAGWQERQSYVVDDSAWATTIDWTRHRDDWASPGGDGSGWRPAVSESRLLEEPPMALGMPRSLVLQELAPESVQRLSSHSYLYIFRQNIIGTVRLEALPDAAPGSRINVTLGEWTEDEVPRISGRRQQFENHLLRPGNAQPLETVFCFHGFQYVRVDCFGETGFSGELSSVTALETRTNISSTSELLFGGDGSPGSRSEQAAHVLNGINSMYRESQKASVTAYMPSDAPTREKLGWLGDAFDTSESAMYSFNMQAVDEAFIELIQANQGPGGDVPVAVPRAIPERNSCADIAWTSAFPQLAWLLYTYYGDERELRRQWPSLQRYTENLLRDASVTADGLAECDQYSDWMCGVVEENEGNRRGCCTTPPEAGLCPVARMMGSLGFVEALGAMANMAQVQHLHDESARYESLKDDATRLYHQAFWNEALETYGGDAGAIQSLTTPALFIGAPPAKLLPHVVDTLQQGIVREDYQPNIGVVVSKIMLNVLSENGLHSTALKVATKRTPPSWGAWLQEGSTTCREAWVRTGAELGASLNHGYLCGGVVEWMWKHLVGLIPTEPGFAKIRLAPKVDPVLGPRSLAATYLSPRGSIGVAWNLSSAADRVALTARIPVGVEVAILAVPKPFRSLGVNWHAVARVMVTDGGLEVWNGTGLVGKPTGVVSAHDSGEAVELTVGSGEYALEARLP